MWEVTKNCATYLLILGTYLLHMDRSSLSPSYAKVVVLLYGIMMCKLLLHLMLAHVTEQPFRSCRISSLIICGLMIFNMSLPRTLRLNEAAMLWGGLAFSVVGMYARQVA